MTDKNVPTTNKIFPQGSHMIGGRTYRNTITTNEIKPQPEVEPQKLVVITTAKTPGPAAVEKTKTADLSQMITTHDEDKQTDLSRVRNHAPGCYDKVDVELEKPIDVGPIKTPGSLPDELTGNAVSASSHKKTGKKKA